MPIWIDGFSVRAHRHASRPRCARCLPLPRKPPIHIPLRGERDTEKERERGRAQELGEEQRKSEKKNGIATQTALMAGIWFAATFLACGISTLVSSARIYPPNEGKVAGGVGGEVPRTSDFIHGARPRRRPRRGASVAALSCGIAELSLYESGGLNLDPFGHMSGFAPAASVSELAVLVSAAKTRDQSFKPRDRFEVRPRKKVLNAQASVKQLRLLQL